LFETPIIVLGFNRADKITTVMSVLEKIKPKRLYAAFDGPRSNNSNDLQKCVAARETLIQSITWACDVRILLRDENLGCRKAVSGALTWFFSQEERGLVIEDDVIPDVSFFPFAASLLDKYRGSQDVGVISGNNFGGIPPNGESYYFSRYFHCWGWATWAEKWQLYDDDIEKDDAFFSSMEFSAYLQHNPLLISNWLSIREALLQSRVNSWAYRMMFSLMRANQLYVTPSINLCVNKGFDEESTHCRVEPHWFSEHKLNTMTSELIHPVKVKNNWLCDQAELYYMYRIQPTVYCIKCRNLAHKISQELDDYNTANSIIYQCSSCSLGMKLTCN
jgi:hypothetical protein